MKKQYVLIGGLIVVGVLIYLWWKNKQSASTAATASQTGTGTPAVTTTVNPVTGQTTASYTSAGGNPVPTAITDYFKTLPPNNQAQAFKMLPQMTDSDIAQLSDIIMNVWGKGASPNAAQTGFWNAWRKKYGILNGTISNFTGKPSTNQYGKRRVK